MKMPHAASLLAIAWLAGTAPVALAQTAPATNAPAAQPTAADLKLKALYDAEWTWRQKEFARLPGSGRTEGGADDHLPSVTAATQQRRYAYWSDILKQLDQIPDAQLSHEEYINKAVFKTSVWENATKIKYKTYEAPFNSDTFFWTGLNPRTPFSSADNYRRYLGRMKDIPRYFDEQIANMQAGLKRGYTVPRVSIVGRDKTIEPFLAAGTDNPFYKAFAAMPDTIPADQRQAMQVQAQALIRDAIAPSYQKLLTFMRGEYMPKARKTIDAYSLPDGKAFYQDQIREYFNPKHVTSAFTLVEREQDQQYWETLIKETSGSLSKLLDSLLKTYWNEDIGNETSRLKLFTQVMADKFRLDVLLKRQEQILSADESHTLQALFLPDQHARNAH